MDTVRQRAVRQQVVRQVAHGVDRPPVLGVDPPTLGRRQGAGHRSLVTPSASAPVRGRWDNATVSKRDTAPASVCVLGATVSDTSIDPSDTEPTGDGPGRLGPD